jgi:hypothetical protein
LGAFFRYISGLEDYGAGGMDREAWQGVNVINAMPQSESLSR